MLNPKFLPLLSFHTIQSKPHNLWYYGYGLYSEKPCLLALLLSKARKMINRVFLLICHQNYKNSLEMLEIQNSLAKVMDKCLKTSLFNKVRSSEDGNTEAGR